MNMVNVIFNIMGIFLSLIGSNLANSTFYNFLTALAGSVGYTPPPFVLFVYYEKLPVKSGF